MGHPAFVAGEAGWARIMRRLGDKSLASSPAQPPGRVPQVRPSVPGLIRGKPLLFLFLYVGVDRWRKHWKKLVFNPCTRKSANMGHPSRGLGLVASRESGGGDGQIQPPNFHRTCVASKRGASLHLHRDKGCENKLCGMNPHQTSLCSVPKHRNSSQERITTTRVPTSSLPRNIT
jgi:hypothetical protein